MRWFLSVCLVVGISACQAFLAREDDGTNPVAPSGEAGVAEEAAHVAPDAEGGADARAVSFCDQVKQADVSAGLTTVACTSAPEGNSDGFSTQDESGGARYVVLADDGSFAPPALAITASSNPDANVGSMLAVRWPPDAAPRPDGFSELTARAAIRYVSGTANEVTFLRVVFEANARVQEVRLRQLADGSLDAAEFAPDTQTFVRHPTGLFVGTGWHRYRVHADRTTQEFDVSVDGAAPMSFPLSTPLPGVAQLSFEVGPDAQGVAVGLTFEVVVDDLAFSVR